MPRWSLWAVTCAACVLGATSWAAAQGTRAHAAPSEEADSSYEALIREALTEFNARNYAEALALFERAHAVKPSARTLRGLGITAFELKRYVQALHDLGAALVDPRLPLTETQAKGVRALIVKARRFVGRIKLEVVPEEAGVLVDGQPSSDRDLVLDLGEHQVSVRAPGYHEEQLKLIIEGGENTTRRVELMPLEVSPQNAAASVPPDDHGAVAQRAGSQKTGGTPLFGKWWFWTAAGVVVAGAAVGLALAVSGPSTTRVEPLTTANTPPGAQLQASMVR